MVKKCRYENCKTQPHYNYSHIKVGLYCGKHKLDGMVIFVCCVINLIP
jgi:hypothetical protein